MAVQAVRVESSEMIKAIHAAKGIVSRAAKRIGCQEDTIFMRAKNDPLVKAAIDEARANRVQYNEDDDIVLADKARQSLHKLVEECNVAATIFVAKTKGGFEGDGFNNGSKITLKIDQS